MDTTGTHDADRPAPTPATAPPDRTRTGGKVEHHLVTVLPVLLAAGAFAVAFAHVHDVAAWAGQPDWTRTVWCDRRTELARAVGRDGRQV